MLKSMTTSKSVEADVLQNTGEVFIIITRKIRIMIQSQNQNDFSVRDMLHKDVYTVEDGGQELELVKISDFTKRVDSMLGSHLTEE